MKENNFVYLSGTFGIVASIDDEKKLNELLEEQTEWSGEPIEGSHGCIVSMNMQEWSIIQNGKKRGLNDVPSKSKLNKISNVIYDKGMNEGLTVADIQNILEESGYMPK